MDIDEIVGEIINLMQKQNETQVTDQWIKKHFDNLSDEACEEIAKHMKRIKGIKVERIFGGSTRFFIDIVGLQATDEDN